MGLIALFTHTQGDTMVAVLIGVFVLALLLFLWRTTHYVVDRDTLTISCGFSQQRLAIQTIVRIRSVHNLLSAPAMSFHRLNILTNDGTEVEISPERPLHFIQELQKRNPNLVYLSSSPPCPTSNPSLVSEAPKQNAPNLPNSQEP